MLEKKGLVKLVEECGELTQIAAKKMARMDADEHWDGAGLISTRLENEIADVMAAASIVVENFNLNETAIMERAEAKRQLFREWMREASADEAHGLPLNNQWQPIETASENQVGLFWLEYEEGHSGREFEHLFMGKCCCWSSVYKATHWMRLPKQPQVTGAETSGDQQ